MLKYRLVCLVLLYRGKLRLGDGVEEQIVFEVICGREKY